MKYLQEWYVCVCVVTSVTYEKLKENTFHITKSNWFWRDCGRSFKESSEVYLPPQLDGLE